MQLFFGLIGVKVNIIILYYYLFSLIKIIFHFVYKTYKILGPNPKIERADMDGTNRKSIVTDSIYWPNGLTLDYTASRIYWADAKHHVIESILFDGSDRKKARILFYHLKYSKRDNVFISFCSSLAKACLTLMQ